MSENTHPVPPPSTDDSGAVAALASSAALNADHALEHASAQVPLGPPTSLPLSSLPVLPVSPPLSSLPVLPVSPPLSSLPVLPVPPGELLEVITRGLSPGADESTRDAARELWTRLAHALQTAPPAAAAMPAPTPMPIASPIPVAPTMPTGTVMPMSLPPDGRLPPLPSTPVATAVRALRQMPADQLLELLLARLRAALPAGGTAPTPKGIQFQLVPAPPPFAAR